MYLSARTRTSALTEEAGRAHDLFRSMVLASAFFLRVFVSESKKKPRSSSFVEPSLLLSLSICNPALILHFDTSFFSNLPSSTWSKVPAQRLALPRIWPHAQPSFQSPFCTAMLNHTHFMPFTLLTLSTLKFHLFGRLQTSNISDIPLQPPFAS